ncbi:hypothetical protein HYV31_01340 [candidate division WWE3 bacterium]|nr:hypothetical protein [candidate division WWE3 bacterium]
MIKIKHTKTTNIQNNESGIGLVETMLALGIGLIVITSMVSLSIFTLRSSLQNKLMLAGTQTATQQIELMRAFRDSKVSWDEFIADVDGTNGINCFTSDCHMIDSGVTTVVAGENTLNPNTAEELKKSFRLTDQSGGAKTLIRVSVNVSWKIGATTKYAHNYTELSGWRSK